MIRPPGLPAATPQACGRRCVRLRHPRKRWRRSALEAVERPPTVPRAADGAKQISPTANQRSSTTVPHCSVLLASRASRASSASTATPPIGQAIPTPGSRSRCRAGAKRTAGDSDDHSVPRAIPRAVGDRGISRVRPRGRERRHGAREYRFRDDLPTKRANGKRVTRAEAWALAKAIAGLAK